MTNGSPQMTLTYLLLVLFLATFIRSALGFGEALIAVPLLALVMPIEVAAPVAVLVSITVAAIILLQDFHQVQFRSAAWLVLFTLLGTPLGLLVLKHAAESLVKLLLGAIIIGFSAWSLLRRPAATLTHDRPAWFFGFIAGVLGGAYGMNGPPLVIYGTLRGWSPPQFRATLQGYFFPASLLVLAGYAVTGLWTATVTRHYLLSLPAVLIAVFLGRAVNQRLSAGAFIAYVHVGLIAVGALLLAQSLA